MRLFMRTPCLADCFAFAACEAGSQALHYGWPHLPMRSTLLVRHGDVQVLVSSLLCVKSVVKKCYCGGKERKKEILKLNCMVNAGWQINWDRSYNTGLGICKSLDIYIALVLPSFSSDGITQDAVGCWSCGVSLCHQLPRHEWLGLQHGGS